MVVIAKPSTLKAAAAAIVNIISPGRLTDEVYYPNIGFRAYLATLDNCDALNLLKEPSVKSVSLDAEIKEKQDGGKPGTGGPVSGPVSGPITGSASAGATNSNSNSSLSTPWGRGLEVGKNLVLQTPAPSHLEWLSSLWTKWHSPALGGSTFYNTRGFLYGPDAAGKGVNIYVLDTAVWYEHIVCSSPITSVLIAAPIS
jgi:hypothetical protein